ncbi:ATPase [Desulfosarcina ovata subsp. sediminis]|uniref:ATPase n=1 Tax=Desulfosarcina ovata subsp. sediminis TaxID=885957 RepID=A0A5K7ZWG5_9BACT|nr:ABC-ATPase domain-containing protein [Desulfosarcina ovata]BBO84568.1 ATPase [Desulfosarcina ovata subsp. sediminis]
MLSRSELKQKLSAIDGRDYTHYQAIRGSYDVDRFKLIVQQVPKDPFAPPHSGVYRIQLHRDDRRIVNPDLRSRVQTIAFADFLARRFATACLRMGGGRRGTGRSGMITIEPPGQAILARNSVVVTDTMIEVRCFLGLPANGRTIDAVTANVMLLDELPVIVDQALRRENVDARALNEHIAVAEDAESLRAMLDPLDLVAFVGEGAILPRESGTSDRPGTDTPLIPFSVPAALRIDVDLPHAGRIRGMGIPKGVTLITGGGYHGKSTLLETLALGIYNHVPGDGRQQCVSLAQTVKVRSHSGRSVVKTDISGFIDNLPFGKDTTVFSTRNASGSTSQAATIIEAIEAGARVLLMDEDTCATNFLIRDRKMQQLVNRRDEPITAFIDRVRQLYTEKGISTVLVLGGVGDYFDVADHVIQMIHYRPEDVTARAHRIAESFPVKRAVESGPASLAVRTRVPLPGSIDPVNAYGKQRIHAQDAHRLVFGEQVVDLTDLEQLKEASQTHAIGYAMQYAKKYMDGSPLRDVIQRVINDIEAEGLDVVRDRICGHLAGFRGLELAFALNRLGGFDVNQL